MRILFLKCQTQLELMHKCCDLLISHIKKKFWLELFIANEVDISLTLYSSFSECSQKYESPIRKLSLSLQVYQTILKFRYKIMEGISKQWQGGVKNKFCYNVKKCLIDKAIEFFIHIMTVKDLQDPISLSSSYVRENFKKFRFLVIFKFFLKAT